MKFWRPDEDSHQIPASFALPESFSPERREALFRETLLLYDLADEIMAATQLDGVVNRSEQVALAIPITTQIRYSATILCAFYNAVVFANRPITCDVQDTFEKAFRDVFEAIEEFIDGAETTLVEPKIPEEIDPKTTMVTGILALELPDVPDGR